MSLTFNCNIRARWSTTLQKLSVPRYYK